MAVASGLTLPEDVLALFAALLLLLHGLITGCLLNRFDSGFCARLPTRQWHVHLAPRLDRHEPIGARTRDRGVARID